MRKSLPIGIFDSGVGGTSIWQEIIAQMPNETTIYLADSKHAPYGQKSTSEIIQLCVKNTEQLLDFGVKLIVVACNTATTNAIDYLRSTYPVPFIGIEPAIKPAALQSKAGKIGILATKGTLNSRLFATTSEKYAGELEVIEVIGEGLVPLIEAGKTETQETKELLTSYIEPMVRAGVDHIVLGCSHYPYLTPLLKKILPQHIQIIDSGAAVARQTQHILIKNKLQATTASGERHVLYSNGDVTILEDLLDQYKEVADFKTLVF